MQPSQPSRLLALPGEILNIIYEHTLTHPTGLYPQANCDFLRPHLYTSPYLGIEFNRLKYTCRKFYNETAGLELRFNTLRFVAEHGGRVSCETRHCLVFLATLPESAQSLIPAISLHGPSFTPRESHYRPFKALSRLFPLSSWCAAHPSTVVTITDPAFNFQSCPFCHEVSYLEVGVLFSLLFNGKDISNFGTATFQARISELADWATQWPSYDQLKVSNIKLRPGNLLNEKTLKKALPQRTVPASVEDVETCLKIARTWSANGV